MCYVQYFGQPADSVMNALAEQAEMAERDAQAEAALSGSLAFVEALETAQDMTADGLSDGEEVNVVEIDDVVHIN
jgi:hypothetical protein